MRMRKILSTWNSEGAVCRIKTVERKTSGSVIGAASSTCCVGRPHCTSHLEAGQAPLTVSPAVDTPSNIKNVTS